MNYEESIEQLKKGAEQYEAQGKYTGDVSKAARRRAVGGQAPFAVVVTCSDSRVIPEAIFSCGIGDIFVIRTAGNVIGDHELASIEYAAHHLHVPLTVVLGHTNCGAVKAAMDGETDGHIGVITAAIQRVIDGEKNPGKALLMNTRNSVRRIRDDLGGSVPHKVVGAIYDIESGHVDWLDE